MKFLATVLLLSLFWIAPLAAGPVSTPHTTVPTDQCTLVISDAALVTDLELTSLISAMLDQHNGCIVKLDKDQCSATAKVEVTVGPVSVEGTFTVTGDCEGFAERFTDHLKDFTAGLICEATQQCENQNP